MIERMRRAFLLAPLACAAIYACDGGETEPTMAGPPDGYEDVVLQGDVTDETLVGFVSSLEEGGLQDDPSQAPSMASPAAGAQLPKGTVPEFSWTSGGAARLAPYGAPVRWAGLAPAPADGIPRSLVRDLVAFGAPLRELLAAPRAAHAHGAPYSGTATFVELTAKDGATLLRVFTSAQKLTPSQAEWDAMAAAAQPITIELTSALFEENRVVADGGPFAGTVIDFTIVP